jgi:hypothetical protein
MVVKPLSENTINEIGEDGLYEFRRNALKQNTKNKIYNIVGNKCELCGRSRDALDLTDTLHIHHIRKVEDFGLYEDACVFPCHTIT